MNHFINKTAGRLILIFKIIDPTQPALEENSSSCTNAIAAGYKTLIGINDVLAGKIDKMRLSGLTQEG